MAAAVAGAAVLVIVGCATNSPDPAGISNLRPVEPGVWRGGQPTAAGWAWLKSAGVSNVIKLNPGDEGLDAGAVGLGMTLHYHPIDSLQMLVSGPDPVDLSNAVAEIGPGTFVHCEHGEDRTGLAVGLYRLREGWTPSAAWSEMVNDGFHPALFGLSNFWAGAAK